MAMLMARCVKFFFISLKAVRSQLSVVSCFFVSLVVNFIFKVQFTSEEQRTTDYGLRTNPLTLLLFLALHRGDGAARDFEHRLVGAQHHQAVLAHRLDGREYAARRDDAVAGLQVRDHVLHRALPLALRADDQEIEDGKDRDVWEKPETCH